MPLIQLVRKAKHKNKLHPILRKFNYEKGRHIDFNGNHLNGVCC